MRLVSNNSLVTTVLLVPGVADHVLLLLLGVRRDGQLRIGAELDRLDVVEDGRRGNGLHTVVKRRLPVGQELLVLLVLLLLLHLSDEGDGEALGRVRREGARPERDLLAADAGQLLLGGKGTVIQYRGSPCPNFRLLSSGLVMTI